MFVFDFIKCIGRTLTTKVSCNTQRKMKSVDALCIANTVSVRTMRQFDPCLVQELDIVKNS